MSLFFVDSGSDLNKNDIKKLGIECLDFCYLLDNKPYEIEEEEKIVSKIKKGLNFSIVKLTAKKYEKIFDECLKQGDDIFYIASSMYVNENLFKAREILLEKYSDRKFEIVEDKNFSIGGGMIAYLCALEYRKGASVEELKDYALKIIDEYALYFGVGALENLKSSGKLDNASVVGTALSIKPIITIDLDGKMVVVDKVSGRKKVILKLIELIRQQGKNVADYPIGIMYSNNEADMEELKAKIYEYFGKDILIFANKLSASNLTLTGLGTLGLAFHVHKKLS